MRSRQACNVFASKPAVVHADCPLGSMVQATRWDSHTFVTGSSSWQEHVTLF